MRWPQNIYKVVDVLLSGQRHARPVIEIELLRSEPPEGWVRARPGDRAEIRFTGWMGLLQAVSMLVEDVSGEPLGGEPLWRGAPVRARQDDDADHNDPD